jgi:hypothetical protein
LNVDRPLGREQMTGPIEVGLKFSSLLSDDATLSKAEDLESSTVRQHRTGPADELMEPSTPRDELVAGPEKQVIGVPEDDLGARLAKVTMKRRLDGSLRTDRHERRGVHYAVRGVKFPATRRAIRAVQSKTERTPHRTTYY